MAGFPGQEMGGRSVDSSSATSSRRAACRSRSPAASRTPRRSSTIPAATASPSTATPPCRLPLVRHRRTGAAVRVRLRPRVRGRHDLRRGPLDPFTVEVDLFNASTRDARHRPGLRPPWRTPWRRRRARSAPRRIHQARRARRVRRPFGSSSTRGPTRRGTSPLTPGPRCLAPTSFPSHLVTRYRRAPRPDALIGWSESTQGLVGFAIQRELVSVVAAGPGVRRRLCRSSRV